MSETKKNKFNKVAFQIILFFFSPKSGKEVHAFRVKPVNALKE